MNKYTGLIQEIATGAGSGLLGMAMFVVTVGGLSVKTSISYALFSMFSGAIALQMAGKSPYSEYKFYLAVLAGWSLFFVVKIISKIFVLVSFDPMKAWNDFKRPKK